MEDIEEISNEPDDEFEYSAIGRATTVIVYPAIAGFLLLVALFRPSEQPWALVAVCLVLSSCAVVVHFAYFRSPVKFGLDSGRVYFFWRGKPRRTESRANVCWPDQVSLLAWLCGAAEVEIVSTGQRIMLWSALERFEEFKEEIQRR